MSEATDQPCFRWYAIHTRSRHEQIVRDELTKKSIENYLPVFHEWRQWKDRKKLVEQPVFSGYIFARFVDAGGAHINVLRTRGAARILGTGSYFSPVPDCEIESVRCMLETDSHCFLHPFLREGAWVRVKRGPLRNLEGLFVQMKSRGRLIVSVNLLSQSVATELDVSEVEVIRPGKQQLDRKGPGLAVA
ncbi:MAG TPA: UpxY family transcription antiterminator [Bryobacteraceae bacterium]|nr:UpxY family transcription antiterminator [Bryobacteraceae bacterium]